VDDAFDRKWLTNDGYYVKKFEEDLKRVTRVDNCVAVCNGTVALQVAAKALGLTGEVIVPSFTFIASAHALSWIGLEPVFCDVQADTHNINPDLIENLITPRTTAILAVHLWGSPCDVEALTRIACEHDLKLIFDAAHAFASSYNQRMIGNNGSCEIFSFHATKFLNSAEGGAVATNDAELAQRARLMRNFGFKAVDTVIELGTNGKMNELSAIMGICSLEQMDAFIDVNRRNYELYEGLLSNLPGIRFHRYPLTERCNYQYIVLEVENRDDLLHVLECENVKARRYFNPGCHRMAPYDKAGHAQSLPVTDQLSEHVLCLPNGTSVSENDVREICSIIRVFSDIAGSTSSSRP
jgi:dTDP-4-amino-4,6-dideoxygalactose transaminase